MTSFNMSSFMTSVGIYLRNIALYLSKFRNFFTTRTTRSKRAIAAVMRGAMRGAVLSVPL